MKFLIALALCAVAFADDVQVVNLGSAPAPAYERPDISPLFVPQDILQAIKNYRPVMRDAPIDDESLKVRIADAPLDVPEEPVVADEGIDGSEVHYVSYAEEIPAPEAVRIAQPSLPVVENAAPEVAEAAPEVIEAQSPFEYDVVIPEAVVLPEAPLPIVETPLPVAGYMFDLNAVRIAEVPIVMVMESIMIAEPMIAEASLPEFEPVRIAEAPLPAVESDMDAPAPVVEPVKVALPSFPGKLYDDAMLR